jgi:hypothetical protein
MKILRIVALVLAIIHLLPVGLTAVVGGFADGGDLWSRLTLMLLHPAAAIILIVIAAIPTPRRNLLLVGSALLALNIVADVTLSLMISTGIMKGDWELPLIFVPVPLIGLIYAQLKLKHGSAENT